MSRALTFSSDLDEQLIQHLFALVIDSEIMWNITSFMLNFYDSFVFIYFKDAAQRHCFLPDN